MSKVLETVTLYMKEGVHDKFYIASLIGEDDEKYSVPVTWGRRGTSGQSGYKAEGVDFATADKAFKKIVKEKLGKGYIEGKGMKPYAGMSDAKQELLTGKSSVDGALEALDKVWDAKRKIDWKDGTKATTVSSGMLPQLLNEISEEEVNKFITDDNYCAQEKHDGRRRILQYSNGKTIGYNKKGIAVGYPSEIEGAIRSVAEVNGLKNFVLDGEEIGDTYYVFDLLSLNGEDLRSQGYGSRYRKIGKQVWAISDSIQVVGTAFTTAEKRFLYDRLKEEGREGIVFKKLSGVHRSGYSDDMRKFKFTFTASVVVTKHNVKNSVAMAVWDPLVKGLVPVGNVTCIGHDRSKFPVGSVIEVRALYAYKGGSLYQPAFIGVRDDVEKEDCLITKLKFKAVDDEEEK